MKKALCLLAAGSLLVSANSFADNKKMKKFTIKVTNISTDHIITPPTVIAHANKYELFHVGEKASEELATMAESGNNAPLMHAVSMEKGVYAVASGDNVIHPGQSMMIEIKAPSESFFTVAGMLAGTNDAFISATSYGAAWAHGSKMTYAETYDAGSEMNNENCEYIPGPPCGNPDQMRAEPGEGYVTIHKGIFGPTVIPGSELNPANMDWRGPNAMISIERN